MTPDILGKKWIQEVLIAVVPSVTLCGQTDRQCYLCSGRSSGKQEDAGYAIIPSEKHPNNPMQGMLTALSRCQSVAAIRCEGEILQVFPVCCRNINTADSRPHTPKMNNLPTDNSHELNQPHVQ